MSQRLQIKLSSSGLSSIFSDMSERTYGMVPRLQKSSEAEEFNISECSSSSDELKDENQRSPVHISDYSSDENTNLFNQSLINKKPTGPLKKSYSARNFQPLLQSRKTKRTPTIAGQKISRNSKKSFGVLSVSRNNKINESPSGPKTSPWQKVRSDFQRLRCTSSRRITTAETNLQEDDIEYVPSPPLFANDKCSQAISATCSSAQYSCSPTELDLLVELIERECGAANSTPSKTVAKSSKKRCRKGGYLHGLMQTLDAAKIDRRFLEHDKNFGLQIGTKVTVLKLETSFGVHLATVGLDSEDDHDIVNIVIDTNLFQRLKVGSSLEAFFGPETESYQIVWNSATTTFIQPYKLLLVK